MRAPIPHISTLLTYFRNHRFPIFHTREGHRPDLSTLSERELLRSRNNPSGLGIGDKGPLGRLLIRGEKGQDIIPELYPITSSSNERGFSPEPVLDKPGKSAFVYTELDLMLRVKGIKNLVVCGVTWEVCVGSTVREAMERGYDCLVVKDAIGCSEGTGAERGESDRGMGGVEMVGVEGGIFGAWVAKATQVVETMEAGAQEMRDILLNSTTPAV